LCTLGLHKNKEKLKKMVDDNLELAKFLYDELVKLYGSNQVKYPFHFNVTFPKPSMAMAKRYQLMITGGSATICVLTNVSRELINQFIEDLKAEKEKEVDMINTTQTTTDYTIQTLKDEHIKSVVDLFTKSFCDSEPITKKLNINYKEYEPFATEVVQKAAKEGMSKVAIDKKNKVVACAIAEDLSDPFIPHLAHYPKMKPIISLIGQLSEPFIAGKRFTKGKIVHVWIAAVDPAYRGKGLSTEIDMACIEAAARKGYDFAYAEFTNHISENVTHHFKMLQLCNRIPLQDFTIDGAKPFAGLTGAADSYVATIRPGVKLESLSNCYKEVEGGIH
jgi:hypothetical protein